MEYNKDFLYINFPKAASTFIWNVIENVVKKRDKTIKKIKGNHDKTINFIDSQYKNKKYVISNIREPITWYGSLYSDLKRSDENFNYFDLSGDFSKFLTQLFFESSGKYNNLKHWHKCIDFSLVNENGIGLMTQLYINYFYPKKRNEIIGCLNDEQDVLKTMDNYEKYNILNFTIKKENVRSDLIEIFGKIYNNHNFSDKIEKFPTKNVSQKKQLNENDVDSDLISVVKKSEVFIYNKYYNTFENV